jgi:hypothetical protein
MFPKACIVVFHRADLLVLSGIGRGQHDLGSDGRLGLTRLPESWHSFSATS